MWICEKLMYLFVVIVVFTFVACGGGGTPAEAPVVEEAATEEVAGEDEKFEEKFYLDFNKYELVTDEILITGYTGKARYTYKDESSNVKYVGEFKNGEYDGDGAIIYEKIHHDFVMGVIYYSGEWKEGKMHGEGILILENGNIYQGELKNGFANGRGVETTLSGDKKEGLWQDGKFLGHIEIEDIIPEEHKLDIRDFIKE